MKLKWLFYTIFSLILLCPFSIYAMTPYEVANRGSECPIIELAEAREDGSLVKVECYGDYNTAKNVMNAVDNDNLVILENRMIIDSKYGVVDYDIDYPDADTNYQYLDVYVDSTSNTTNGAYIRGGSPDEAVLLDYDYNTKRVKIKVAGLTGWITKNYRNFGTNGYDIVPLAWVKTPQYYQATNDDQFIHYFPGNVYGTKGTGSFAIDRKPEMLNVGYYYSYDGHYFYTNMKSMIQDYKNGNYNQSVNKDQPYYNYYQYVSFRTLTNHEISNIDLYFQKRVSSSSKMLSTAAYFVDTQNKYGVNAALMLAIGMNESAGGDSNLARTKNNLFGLNAVDASPGASANYFATVADCISTYGYVWLSYWYLEPGDFHFKGANLGNKGEGLNYKYASDPFWGEKAAHYYYDLDKMFGFPDRNSYQVAVLNNDYNGVVYAKKTPGGANVSSSYYQYTTKDMAVVVLEEVQGPAVNGNTTWYKIQSDPNIDANLEYHGNSKSNPRIIYTWGTSYVYVPAAYFMKVNTATFNIPPIPDPNAVVLPAPVVSGNNNGAKQISSIVMEASYKYTTNIIFGITPNTQVESMRSNLTNTGGQITITDKDGNMKTNGTIGTGDIIHITSGNTETLTALIYGDIDGDGEISAVDYVKIKNSIMGVSSIDGIYKTAADVNGDSQIDAVDYVNIKNYIMGSSNIINN